MSIIVECILMLIYLTSVPCNQIHCLEWESILLTIVCDAFNVANKINNNIVQIFPITHLHCTLTLFKITYKTLSHFSLYFSWCIANIYVFQCPFRFFNYLSQFTHSYQTISSLFIFIS